MSTTPLNVAIPDIDQLTQNAARSLQQSLAQAVQSAQPAQLSPVDLELARSNIKALAFVQAVGLHGAYRYLRDFVARQAIPIKAEGEFLEGWLESYGMVRKSAAAASGTASGTGLAGSLLPTGTLLQSADGRLYKVSEDAVVSGATVQPALIAAQAGLAGNLAAGTALNLVSPVLGIDTAFTADAPSGLSGGADVETDAQAVYRLAQRLANEPMGGSPEDYARWALAVPSITRAWGLRTPFGPCTAGVIIMADGNLPNGLPTPAQAQQVTAYIQDPQRGPPDELFVLLPVPVVVDVTLTITPDTSAIRAAVVAAAKDLFYREAIPGRSIPQSHLTEAISGVLGEYNHAITAPVISSGAFFSVTAFDQLLVLGTVSFT